MLNQLRMRGTMDRNSTRDRTAEYNKTYYEKKKREINARKKERYRTDPAYRALIDAARKRQQLRMKAKLNGRVLRVYRGAKIEVIKIGNLCTALKKTADWFYNLEDCGVIPKYDQRFGRSRCYTNAQIIILQSVAQLQAEGLPLADIKKKMGSTIKSNW